jgi:hypothetical protein
MKTRLFLIFLILTTLLVAIPLQVFGEEQVSKPAIGIMQLKNPLAGNYPIKIYIYPMVYVSENETGSGVNECGEVFLAIHDAIRDLHHIIARFIDEHPEYYQLILIRFINASDEAAADITVKIFKRFGPESAGALGYALFGENRPLRMGLLCSSNLTYSDYYSTFLHELFHVLGVDHANQTYTNDGEWELMYPAGPLGVKSYPSTLDLYALYIAHFGNASGGVATLPDNIPYIQVQPYYIQLRELESLRKENEKLRAAASENVILRDKLDWTQKLLNNYIKSYDALRSKYVQLARNCSSLFMVCNQTINGLTAKLANMTTQYNQCANQFNRLYEEHQALVKDYDDLAARFTFLAATYFAVVAILGGGALWVSLAYGALRDRYHELLEKLEGGVENE